MGKKRTRTKYVSKGQRRNVAKSTLKAVAADTTVLDTEMNKYKAWKKGKNPWILVKTDSKKAPYKKVKANTVYGSPNRNSSNTNKERQSEWTQ